MLTAECVIISNHVGLVRLLALLVVVRPVLSMLVVVGVGDVVLRVAVRVAVTRVVVGIRPIALVVLLLVDVVLV